MSLKIIIIEKNIEIQDALGITFDRTQSQIFRVI